MTEIILLLFGNNNIALINKLYFMLALCTAVMYSTIGELADNTFRPVQHLTKQQDIYRFED